MSIPTQAMVRLLLQRSQPAQTLTWLLWQLTPRALPVEITCSTFVRETTKDFGVTWLVARLVLVIAFLHHNLALMINHDVVLERSVSLQRERPVHKNIVGMKMFLPRQL